MTPPSGLASAFADLHHRDEPLLLPNAWDHASAVALAAQGFRGDRHDEPRRRRGRRSARRSRRPPGDQTLQLALNLGTEPFLLSVDAEGGFSDDPSEVGEFARELSVVGAAGINLEDGREDGLGPPPCTPRRSPR